MDLTYVSMWGGILMALNNVNIYGFKLCEYLWL